MVNEIAVVTGGAGFIGSTAVDRLVAGGSRVVVVDDFSSGRRANLGPAAESGRLEIHELDIRSDLARALIESARPDFLLHFAAQIDVRVSVADPVMDASINVLGTLNVLEGARASGARRFIVASSAGIYGDTREMPIGESAARRPASPYAVGKAVIEQYLDAYRDLHGLTSVILVLANVCGPRQVPHGEAGVVSVFLNAMLDGRLTTIYGDGSQTRDFVFVADVADAFARATMAGEGLYNIGTGVQTSVLELWELCAAATGYTGSPQFAPARAGELRANALDSSRARRDLDWAPTVDVAEAIERTVDWFRFQRADRVPRSSGVRKTM